MCFSAVQGGVEQTSEATKHQNQPHKVSQHPTFVFTFRCSHLRQRLQNTKEMHMSVQVQTKKIRQTFAVVIITLNLCLLCCKGSHTCVPGVIMQTERFDPPAHLLFWCRHVCFVAGVVTSVYLVSLCRQKDLTHLCSCYYHADLCLHCCRCRHTCLSGIMMQKIWHTCAAVIIMQTYVCTVAGADTPVYLVSWCRLDTPAQLLLSCRPIFALFQGQTHLCPRCYDADLTHLCCCYYCADMFALLQGHTCVPGVMMQQDLTHLCSYYHNADMIALLQGQTHLCTWHHDAKWFDTPV